MAKASNSIKQFITPRDVSKNLFKILKAGLVPMLHGSPGIGKSALVKEVAEKFNLDLIDIRLSMYEPIDFAGIPFKRSEDEDRATYLPFDTIPLEGDEVPKGKNGFLLFLDEFNHARQSTAAAAYKLIYDRQIGNHNIHPKTLIVTAGNLESDRALVEVMGTATNSRLIHLYMKPDSEEWIEDIAIPNGYDPRIIGFIKAFPDKFYDFDPESNQDSFSSPRSWDFLNRMIKGIEDVDTMSPIVNGTLSISTGNVFIRFCKFYEKVPKVEDIVRDPEGTELPEDRVMDWVVTTSLPGMANEENLPALITYLRRIGFINVMLFIGMVTKMNPMLSRMKCVTDLHVQLADYFKG